MFWIGMAAGVTVAFLVVIVAFASIAWSVSRDRQAGIKERDDDRNTLKTQWAEANRLSEEKSQTLKKLVTLLENASAK